MLLSSDCMLKIDEFLKIKKEINHWQNSDEFDKFKCIIKLTMMNFEMNIDCLRSYPKI